MRPVRAARVVDASFCAAIYFREPRYREAMRLVQGVDLFAPTLLNYEMASAAAQKIDESPRQRESIVDGLSNFLSAGIHRLDVDYLAVVEVVAATGLTLYDASYFYMARLMGLPLLTFDGELSRVARNMGFS